MSDKARYAYFAGIMDGEGTITICRSEYMAKRKAEGIRPARQYHTIGISLKISVKNTDLRLIKWLKSRFGGEYYLDTGKKPANWNDSYVWHHKAESKEEFLLAILPYLIVKREQALTALEYLRLGRNVRCPEKRQALYEKIVALNQRGKPVEANSQESSEEDMIESVLIGDDESTPVVTQAV
jgi:intein/homing endonuclease